MRGQMPAGGRIPDEVIALLGEPPPAGGGRLLLDFDAALADASAAPLPLENGSLTLIWAMSAFTHLVDGWAEWLLEAGRLLAEDGIVVVGLGERERFEQLTDCAWDESRIGMTVLDAMNEAPQTAVFHSAWWLRSHWGGAFARVELLERDGLRHALLSQPVGGITAEQLSVRRRATSASWPRRTQMPRTCGPSSICWRSGTDTSSPSSGRRSAAS